MAACRYHIIGIILLWSLLCSEVHAACLVGYKACGRVCIPLSAECCEDEWGKRACPGGKCHLSYDETSGMSSSFCCPLGTTGCQGACIPHDHTCCIPSGILFSAAVCNSGETCFTTEPIEDGIYNNAPNCCKLGTRLCNSWRSPFGECVPNAENCCNNMRCSNGTSCKNDANKCCPIGRGKGCSEKTAVRACNKRTCVGGTYCASWAKSLCCKFGQVHCGGRCVPGGRECCGAAKPCASGQYCADPKLRLCCPHGHKVFKGTCVSAKREICGATLCPERTYCAAPNTCCKVGERSCRGKCVNSAANQCCGKSVCRTKTTYCANAKIGVCCQYGFKECKGRCVRGSVKCV